MIVKRKLVTETKRFFTFILSVVTIFALLPLSGCVKEEKIEDYPEAKIEAETEAEDTTQAETLETKELIKDEPKEMTDEEFAELIAIRDPFESGHFTYCPDAIPHSYAMGFRDKPKIIKNAKYILMAVYEGESKWEVPKEDAISQNQFKTALDLAKLSNPVAERLMGSNSEDGTSFTICNFPKMDLPDNEEAEDEVEVDENSPYEMAKRSQNILDYVVDTINRNVSKDSSDIEKAEAVYKALVSDFTPVMRGAYNEEETVVLEDGSVVGVILPKPVLINDFYTGAMDNRELSQLYQFILTQLNIECMTVFSYGKYSNQDIEELDEFMQKNGNNIWNVVICDGKAYNCDLFFETAALQKLRIKYPQIEPDMTYFGMSDAVRNKSFEANKELMKEYTLYEKYEAFPCLVKGGAVPECAEDYYSR